MIYQKYWGKNTILEKFEFLIQNIYLQALQSMIFSLQSHLITQIIKSQIKQQNLKKVHSQNLIRFRQFKKFLLSIHLFSFIAMSIASSSYKPKSLQQSSDMQDLRQQVKFLVQQNKNLTLQLQQLIEVNNQLTSSIQQYNKFHEQKFGNLDQQQLQQLANQISDLQNQLKQQKQKNYQLIQYHQKSNSFQPQKRPQNNIITSNTNNNPQHSRQGSGQMQQEQIQFNIEQIFEVIKQLTNNIQYLQQLYPQQLQNLQQQLYGQRQNSQKIFREMEEKFLNFNEISKQLISELQSRDQVINNLNREISIQKNKKSQIHKQMKISFTIEDLKNTLQKKIQQKDQIIKAYEALFIDLKNKVGDFTVSL